MSAVRIAVMATQIICCKVETPESTSKFKKNLDVQLYFLCHVIAPFYKGIACMLIVCS